MFHDDSWRDLLEKPEPTKSEIAELVGRVSQYMGMNTSSQLSIAEAMVTYQDRITDEDTCQVFVPFLSDVRLGTFSDMNGDTGDSDNLLFGHTNSLFKSDRSSSPPSSPNISKHGISERSDWSGQRHKHDEAGAEHMELQLDYWFCSTAEVVCSKNERLFGGMKSDAGDSSRRTDSEKSKKQTDLKSSIKTHFKNLSISQLSQASLDQTHSFTMSYTTKEKKPKAVLKIGKKKDKPGDVDSKFQCIDGINRLICMSKSNLPLKVAIDSQEWSGVKFFQVSSQWQTHIKYLPVCVGSSPDHL